MIGIFWIYDSIIYCYKEEVTNQNDQDVEVGHVDYWQTLQSKYKELNEYPYDYVPRGRVLLKNGDIIVYSSKEIINNEEYKKLIIDSFQLKNVKFKYDEHYKKIYDLGFEVF